MKYPKSTLLGLIFPLVVFSQEFKQNFISTDITNFLSAYDKIIATSDSATRLSILRREYIDRGSQGLKDLIASRNYTEQEFLTYINSAPLFWNSIRQDLTNVSALQKEIEKDILSLKELYPSLRPADIYFAVGAFRTNGTVFRDRVLIGSELALAGPGVQTAELPEWRRAFYTEYNPRKNIALLCTHEYIHTQQKELVHNLLSKCLYEGIAEFVSCIATGKPSNSPAIAYGKANREKVIALYARDLFSMSNDFSWLWGENRNELKVRDLGYYVGYEIAERYYKRSKDKKGAIKTLIELDYHDEKLVEQIVDGSDLLPGSLNSLYESYQARRPMVTGIRPFSNGSDKVKPGITKITIEFSEPLNGYNTGIDFGPLGESNFPKLSPARTWGADGRSWTIEANLEPNKKYQVMISNNFRKTDGTQLKPFLIEFQTGD